MHYPDLDVDNLPVSAVLKEHARRLVEYVDQDPEVHIANRPEHLLSKRLAAVLILLFERDGVVRVLLTTRSKLLRSHPGQVALPGGKSDPEDETPFVTALREANEEVGLPLASPHVHILRTMPPFPSLYKLIVTPVVAILSNNTVLESLSPNPEEVDDIFDHPLEAFLDPTIMRLNPNLSPFNSEKWMYPDELWNYSDSPFLEGSYRNNRLRSTSTPIKGLTSSLMIQVASIAFARQPSYAAFPPDAVPVARVVESIIQESKAAALAHLRLDDSATPDMGMTRANTPVPIASGFGEILGSVAAGGRSAERRATGTVDVVGDTIAAMPAS